MQDQAPQKLSKPLTNRTSSHLLASTSHSFESSSPLAGSDAGSADGYFPSVTSPHGQRKGRRNTRSKIRSYFQGSPEADQHHSSEDDDGSQRRNTNWNSRQRMSRTDSSIFQNPNVGASPASSASYLCMADARGPGLSEDDAVKRQITEKVWTDALAAQNHVSTPVDEDKHPDSVMSPIRRRSLYTPGIATRSPEDILRKPPPRDQIASQADRDYYYDPARPASSPLSRLANLRTSHTGRSTPSELDYTHLGALKLGTLRVTNGAASPIPRNRHVDPAPNPEVASQDDYYTASEGKNEEDDRSNVDSASTDTSRISQEDVPDVAATQSTPTNCRSIKRKPLPPTANAMGHDQSSRPTVNPPIPQRMSYPIRDSPSTELSPRYNRHEDLEMTRSFAGATKDQYSGNGPREEAYLKLTGRPTPWHQLADTTTPATHFQNVDSGYSSNTSLETVQKPVPGPDVDTRMVPPLPSTLPCSMHYSSSPSDCTWEKSQANIMTKSPRDALGTDEAYIPVQPFNRGSRKNSFSGAAQGGSSLDTDILSATSTRLPCKEDFSPEKSRKLQKKRPKSQPPLQRIASPAHHRMDHDEIPPVPLAIASLHSERVSKFPSLDHTFSSPQHTEPDEVFFSPVLRTDQSAQAPEELKQDAQPFLKRLAMRARSRSRSKSRARQVSQHSDEEVDKSEICRSPSWSDYGNRKKKGQKRRQKVERESQNHSGQDIPPAKAIEPTQRSRFRSRSRGRSPQPQHFSTPTDIGIIQQSLGVGPYDIALTDPRSPTGRPKVQPHDSHQTNPAKNDGIPPPGLTKAKVQSSRSRSYSIAETSLPSTKRVQDQTNAVTKATRPQTMFFSPQAIPAMPIADLRQKIGNERYLSQYRDPRCVEDKSQEPEPTQQGTSAMDNPRESEPTRVPSSICTKDSSTDTTTSVEELIDALLDATSVEAREVILQQIRHKRRQSQPGSNNPGLQKNVDEPKQRNPSPLEKGITVTQGSNLSSGSFGPQSQPPKSEKTNATAATASDHIQPRSTSIDTPPSETWISSRPQAPTTPKKDLWAGGAIQTEHRKAIESNTDWDSHRLAWSSRRKSAGEALLKKTAFFTPAEAPCYTDPVAEMPAKRSTKAFHRPWTPPLNQSCPPPATGDYIQSERNVAASGQGFERRTGRFEGGLLYGYEPGFGLGGSAGTRGMKTGATRKSLHISQGYGVDLSDVPIFVAPSK
ncbi:MAG: hypothetical protein Q9220_006119 [cf. Caloplaca sp. 1 TL-2023]